MRQRLALVAASLLGVAGCGGGGSPAASTRSPTSSPTASPTGPCAAVKQTTVLSAVSPACQAVWRPYGVTKVPPADLLASTPRAPKVGNHTAGKLDDATAQRWADAANRDSTWGKWALAYGQPSLLTALNGPAAIGGEDVAALAAGATIQAADCNLYPKAVELWPVDSLSKAYFAQLRAPTSASFILVGTFAGCSSSVTYPDGRTAPIDKGGGGTILAPGVDRNMYPLGDIWYSDSVGSCALTPPPPSILCGR